MLELAQGYKIDAEICAVSACVASPWVPLDRTLNCTFMKLFWLPHIKFLHQKAIRTKFTFQENILGNYLILQFDVLMKEK